MLVSRRKIPKIGGALLLVGGCGSHAADTESVASDYCRELQRCDPSFAEYYASVGACADDLAAEIEEEASSYEDPSCGDALVAYYACFIRTIDGCARAGDDIFLYDERSAERCYDALYEACPDIAYSY